MHKKLQNDRIYQFRWKKFIIDQLTSLYVNTVLLGLTPLTFRTTWRNNGCTQNLPSKLNELSHGSCWEFETDSCCLTFDWMELSWDEDVLPLMPVELASAVPWNLGVCEDGSFATLSLSPVGPFATLSPSPAMLLKG